MKQMTPPKEEAKVASDCTKCDKLKELVFSAKQAIDQLKGEIEVWKDVCTEKEKEMRQIKISKKSSKKAVGF